MGLWVIKDGFCGVALRTLPAARYTLPAARRKTLQKNAEIIMYTKIFIVEKTAFMRYSICGML